MPENVNVSWFEEWFDSEYYHILYQHRDEEEARLFLYNLVKFLQPISKARMLDLGCGKGRHAVFLNEKGFDVTGVDLSENSIRFAEQYQNEYLSFYVHDMRKPFRVNYFDFVLNLFTSFGYFEHDRENLEVIKYVSNALKKDGVFVLDYLNIHKAIKMLIPSETKLLEGISFDIKKNIEDGFIRKQIDFDDQGRHYTYREKVRTLIHADFEKYFQECGLKLLNLFGDYHLNPFDEESSDRLIMIVQKNA